MKSTAENLQLWEQRINERIQSGMKIEEWCKKNGVTPHVFRHTKAMHLLQAGVNIVYIRDILGHVDINTTDLCTCKY